MTLLDAVVSWLVQHGPTLLLGVTVVLLAGSGALLASRSLAQRRRLGVWTAIGALLYLVLGAVPLPRVTWPAPAGNETPLVESVRAAQPPVVEPELRAAALERALADLQVDAAGTSPPAVLATPLPATLPVTPAPAAAEPAATGTAATGSAATAPAVASPAAAEPPFAWPALLASAWLSGAVFFLLRHLVGTARLRRLLAACTAATPAAVPGLALPNGTRLLLSPHRVRPFCTGVVRPVIVLPRELVQPHRLAEARAVLAHEAAHLRAGDGVVAALLAWLAIPLFCHPLYWWLCREVRFCNELLADDDAAGPDRSSYARALLDLAEHDQPALAASGTVAVFHRPSEFYRRIQMLLQRRGPLSSRSSRLCRATSAVAALCCVGAVAGVFGTPVAAQEPGGGTRTEAELRETIAALRAEIRELLPARQEAGASGMQMSRATVDLLYRAVRDEKTRSELLNRLRRDNGGRLEFTAPPGKAQDTVRTELGDARERQPAASEVMPGRNEAARDSLRSVLEGNRFYRVQRGDSLESIAQRRLGKASQQDEVRRLNPQVDWQSLKPGERILLPRGDSDVEALPWLRGQRDQPADDAQRPGAGEGPSPANATGDLATRYLDLQAEIEIAEAVAAESRQLADKGLAPALEARKAAINLRTLQKKFGIVQRLLDGEIAATEAEIGWLSRRIEAAEAAERDPLAIQLERARTRLEAMRTVK